MITGIYGVNIAVKDLDEATRKYESFFGVKARKVAADFFAFAGLIGSQIVVNGFHINLIASVQPGTPVATFLERRGEGVFLLSVEVNDIERDVAEIREKSATVILDANANGKFGAVNFVHPKSMAGVQIEIYQPSRAMSELPPAETIGSGSKENTQRE